MRGWSIRSTRTYVATELLRKFLQRSVNSHSSSMTAGPLPEVFLSFRGPDTRWHFAKFLHMMLKREGIDAFMDEIDLPKGNAINDELIAAINHSMILIPVITKGYASSKSCLMELEQMLKCKDNKSHTIIPIFYYVKPSDVRCCTGPFAASFRRHNDPSISATDIKSWMSALGEIGQIHGYHLHGKNGGDHFNLTMKLVRQVQQTLNKEDVIVSKKLVGVNPHVKRIMEQLDVNYCNGQAVNMGRTRIKVLGIYGIAGVGKTVLAKYVYDQLCHLCTARSFCENIQDEIEHHDVLYVQKQLISNLGVENAPLFRGPDNALIFIQRKFKKTQILLLLDDVKDHKQLGKLVGTLDWLGPGSRVIVTSQRNDVLQNIDGAETFDLDLMGEEEALTLFCRHAFGADSPRQKFKNLSKKIVAATSGLPLALELLGSSLRLAEDPENACMEALNALKDAPNNQVQAALEKSYKNLDENEKQIFLDIACFFVGKDNRIPYYMWADCKFIPSLSILALKARSFVEIGEDNELRMHEILKNFGREMVKKENGKAGKRSRLWNHEEALSVLKKKRGTEKVEALGLEFGDRSEEPTSLYCDEFDGFENLRFLKLDQADIQGNFGDRLSSLRWLDWQGCPKVFDIQSLNLNLEKLVILDLSESQVDEDWSGWKLLEKARKLKVLKLTDCVQLIETPKFPASMKLERLILEGCSKLEVVHRSFGKLKKLVSLNMKQCRSLYELPDLSPMRDLKELVIDGTAITRIEFQEGSMTELKILSARDCKSLTQISNGITQLKSLTYLALDGSDIATLEDSIGSLEQLQTLSLKNCQRLTGLPDGIAKLRSLKTVSLKNCKRLTGLPGGIGKLRSLKTLSLKNCEELTNLPDGIGKLSSLQVLDLSYTAINELPMSVKNLKAMKVLRMGRTYIRKFPQAILKLEKLEEIDFSLCQSLRGMIPDEIRGLKSLAVLNLSLTGVCGLPECLSDLSRLQKLDISRCDKLKNPPELPSRVIIVH